MCSGIVDMDIFGFGPDQSNGSIGDEDIYMINPLRSSFAASAASVGDVASSITTFTVVRSTAGREISS